MFFSNCVLMLFKVEAQDNKGHTPLFYAAKENSLENVLDLLEMGGADPNHKARNGKTPLFKAHSYECALLLLQNKAQAYEGRHLRFRKTVKNANRPDTPFSYLVRHHAGAAEAILDEALESVNDDLFIYDLEQFKNVSELENEMDFHFTLKENGKSELLLHPIMEIFLHMKWNLMNTSMTFHFLFNILFVVLLTFLGQYYLNLTTCIEQPVKVFINDGSDNFFTMVLGNHTCVHRFDETLSIACDEDDEEHEYTCHKNSIRTSKDPPYTLEEICNM